MLKLKILGVQRFRPARPDYIRTGGVQRSRLPDFLLIQRYVRLTLDFGARRFCIPKKTSKPPDHTNQRFRFSVNPEPLNPEPLNP